jgi:hypothetical protein
MNAEIVDAQVEMVVVLQVEDATLWDKHSAGCFEKETDIVRVTPAAPRLVC